MSEAVLTKRCKKYFDKTSRVHPDFYFHKVSDKFTSGIPDYYVLFRGVSIWIELKAKGETIRPIQNHVMKRLHRAGAITLWTSEFDQVKRLAEQFEHQAIHHHVCGTGVIGQNLVQRAALLENGEIGDAAKVDERTALL